MPNNFFEEPQLAAFLKHQVLEKYLPVFTQKAGTSPGVRGQVDYLDGFAGPGRYDDGSPGSPAIAVEAWRRVEATKSNSVLVGHFVEEKRAHCDALEAMLADEGLDTWPVYKGDVANRLADVMAKIPESSALFAFFDPFGLGIPLDLLEQKVFARTGPTEVLLNFSLPGLRRPGGHLTSSGSTPSYLKARETILKNIDGTMGGDWWRDIWTSGADDRENQIRSEYVQRLNTLGWAIWIVAVADRWQGPPSYYLLHLSRHRDGHWFFAQALSSALGATRTRAADEEGRLDFEPDDEWVAAIVENLEAELQKGPQVAIQSNLKAVMGETIGYAREKHIRAAIKELYRRGKTSTNGVGKVQTMVVVRA